ncbi:hypothetical protein [Rhizobium cremeum]|uniref:hypothetical protein n=1 Tax=Rhizobium cremeum TaxID=2813827 RepID=UPI0013B01F31
MSYAGMPPHTPAMSRKNTKLQEKKPNEALIEDWPDDPPSETDDFEGSRNWAMILIFLALSVLPVIGLALLLF